MPNYLIQEDKEYGEVHTKNLKVLTRYIYGSFESIDKPYAVMKKGGFVAECKDIEEGIDVLRVQTDTNLPAGFSFISKPTYADRVYRFEQPVAVRLSADEVLELSKTTGDPIFTADVHESTFEDPNAVVTHEIGSIHKVEYSPVKSRMRRKRPEYVANTRKRQGKVPIYWFERYARLIDKLLDLPVTWIRGWGTWQNTLSNYHSCSAGIKRSPLPILDGLRLQPEWAELVEAASHYIDGVEVHRKEHQVMSLWAKDMRQECIVLDIPVPTYQKKKKGESHE